MAVYYYIFDLLELDGEDVRPLPLSERRTRLKRALALRGHLRATPYRRGDGVSAFSSACRRGWEGVVAKRIDSPYRPARSRDWLKVKCAHGQELVIGGWTAPRGARARLGALLVGYYEHAGCAMPARSAPALTATRWSASARDGKLRQPRYQGLRDDKQAREVVRETPS